MGAAFGFLPFLLSFSFLAFFEVGSASSDVSVDPNSAAVVGRLRSGCQSILGMGHSLGAFFSDPA